MACWAHLCDHLSDVPKVGTPSEPALGQEILDQPRPDIVAHPLELLVDLCVVVVVLYQLHDQRAIREREQLGVLFLSSQTRGRSTGGSMVAYDLF